MKYIVLHQSGPGKSAELIRYLRAPETPESAHFFINTQGTVSKTLSLKKEANHAGPAKWDGRRIDNRDSIAIELMNLGMLTKVGDTLYYTYGREKFKCKYNIRVVHSKITYPNGDTHEGWHQPYTDNQLYKLVYLCQDLVKKFPNITRNNIMGHYEVAVPYGRKIDPFGLDIEDIKDRVFGV